MPDDAVTRSLPAGMSRRISRGAAAMIFTLPRRFMLRPSLTVPPMSFIAIATAVDAMRRLVGQRRQRRAPNADADMIDSRRADKDASAEKIIKRARQCRAWPPLQESCQGLGQNSYHAGPAAAPPLTPLAKLTLRRVAERLAIADEMPPTPSCVDDYARYAQAMPSATMTPQMRARTSSAHIES